MEDSNHVGIYLDDELRGKVEAGRQNFVCHTMDALVENKCKVSLFPNTPEELQNAKARPGYSLFHNHAPTHDRALTFSVAYLSPFWRIERARLCGG